MQLTCFDVTFLCRSVGVILLMAQEQKGRTVQQIMQRLLQENPNDPDIKRQLKVRTDNAEKHTYYALTGSEEEYLQTYGLTYHDQEHFNYINMILHERTVQFLDHIADNKIEVKSTLPPPPPPPPETPKEIVDEVEEVLRNIDLPLSLFKRQDQYWSQDNPKTVQVKEYIKELHDKDRQWKSQLKKRRQEILNEKNEEYHRTIEQQAKTQQKAREEEKIRMIRKIEQIKNMGEARKRTIQQSLEFMKKQGRPLFKKMEEQFYNRVELPSLQEKKRKLTEVRELRRSVDLQQIQQHREKYDKIKEEHEGVKIQNQPVKVSFKGEFYKSIEKSAVTELTESRSKSLVDRRLEYAQMIKENFKPRIDEEKAAEVAERVESMKKRFTRAKNKFQRSIKGEDEEDQEEEEEQEEPEPEPEPEDEQEDEQEEEDQFKINVPKDDQYQPSHEQRYKMGLKYLQIAKSKRKAQRQKQLAQAQKAKTQADSSTTQLQPPPIPLPSSVPSNQSARKIKYRNYLHQMSKTNKTIDFIDTSRMRNQLTADLHIKNREKVDDISNRIRSVQEKAKQEEELLRFKKVKRQQAIDKKLQLDGAIIDTIKVRLAMMNN